ncbi:MAG: nitroreductase [Acidimicrobiales bacterium]
MSEQPVSSEQSSGRSSKEPGCSVTDAVNRRKTIRKFTDAPVADATIRQLLAGAARAPSGGNVQPWRVFVVNGESMARFRAHIADLKPGKPEYEVYPPNLWDPYRTNRFELGELMYATMGIARDNKEARYAHLARNLDFFGAPASIFCFIDRKMGSAQWSDLGMFLQTFMLLAQEAGLDTCPQEAWAPWAETIQTFVEAPEDEMLFCGVALGTADWDAPVNSLESPRMPVDQFATWV